MALVAACSNICREFDDVQYAWGVRPSRDRSHNHYGRFMDIGDDSCPSELLDSAIERREFHNLSLGTSLAVKLLSLWQTK